MILLTLTQCFESYFIQLFYLLPVRYYDKLSLVNEDDKFQFPSVLT